MKSASGNACLRQHISETGPIRCSRCRPPRGISTPPRGHEFRKRGVAGTRTQLVEIPRCPASCQWLSFACSKWARKSFSCNPGCCGDTKHRARNAPYGQGSERKIRARGTDTKSLLTFHERPPLPNDILSRFSSRESRETSDVCFCCIGMVS